MEILRNDIWFADMQKTGSVQGGLRPCYILQNNAGNSHSPTVIIAPLTTKIKKENQPTHVKIEKNIGDLAEDSILLCEQIQTINKKDLQNKIGHVYNLNVINQVNGAIKISLAL